MFFNSGSEMWHTDNFFKRMPVTPFILSAREVPSVEGNAKFASGRAAYSHLSEEMRQHMRSMMAIYDFAYSLSPVAPRLMTERQKRETPPVPQAAVRVNVSIGQKNLYMGTMYVVCRRRRDGLSYGTLRTSWCNRSTCTRTNGTTMMLLFGITVVACTGGAPGIDPVTGGLFTRQPPWGASRLQNRSSTDEDVADLKGGIRKVPCCGR